MMSGVTRITKSQAMELCGQGEIHELAILAAEVCRELHGDEERSYVVERNINYTNVCQTRCSFCAFSVSGRSEKAYTLTVEDICRKIEPLSAIGGTQILLQGGMNAELSLGWYEGMLAGARGQFPELHIHAFSPPEICFLAQQSEMSVAGVLERLRAAGLDSVPGGGAEILVDRVRGLIAPAKCSAQEWLDVMRQAHRMGISTTATMMFGHVETMAERIEHLGALRRLQDESLERREKNAGAGVFTAFTCWPFQSCNTRLGGSASYDPLAGRPRGSNELLTAGAVEQLKMTALARIFLDNFRNIQASWVTQGPKIGQLGLLAGCNDIGSLMMEENVVAAAGTAYQVQLDELREMITGAGFWARQRDYYYNLLPEDSRIL